MFPKGKKTNTKLDKLLVEKLPVVANFHDVIKSCRDRKSSCLPLFYLLQVFSISRGFYLWLDTMIDSQIK